LTRNSFIPTLINAITKAIHMDITKAMQVPLNSI
jgi:hypothetical protein